MAICVNAVDGVLRGRAGPHILQEVLEVVPPSLADRNPTTAVERVVFAVPVKAPLLNASPNDVLGSSRQAMGKVVFGVLF